VAFVDQAANPARNNSTVLPSSKANSGRAFFDSIGQRPKVSPGANLVCTTPEIADIDSSREDFSVGPIPEHLRLIVVIGWERLSREPRLPSQRMIAAMKPPKLHSTKTITRVIFADKTQRGDRNAGASKADRVPRGLAN
jgi:hypothetical protein